MFGSIRTLKRSRFQTSVALLVGAAIVAAPATAQASPPAQSPAQRVVAELAAVPNLVGTTAGATLPAGQAVSIQLNGSAGTTSRVAGNLTVTPNALPYIDAAVKADAAGSSHIVVLKDSAASSNIAFTVTKAGTRLVADPLGGVTLVDEKGKYDSRISAPWAYDAKGRSLPTSFTVTGNVITQHINTYGASFPVVADPHWTWGYVTGTVYFNRSETEFIAAYENWLTIAGWFVPPPFDTLLAIYQLYLHYEAQYAESVGICVKIKSTGTIGTYGGSQGDGYCR
jgi:hypothetical protein